MPNATAVLNRVLREARRLLGAPDLPEAEVAQALLGAGDGHLGALAERTGLREKYLRYEVLPLALYPDTLRRALSLGMPMRQVQRLKRRLEQGELSQEQLETALASPGPRQALKELLARPERRFSPRHSPVWIYPSDPELQGAEALHPYVAEALVEVYTRPGQFVLDPMAGTGAVVRAALRLGRRAEGRDIRPMGEGILEAPVATLPQDYPEPVADLLVLHPPVFTRWSVRNWVRPPDAPYVDPYVDYLEHIVHDLMAPAVGALKPGGYLALVARPRQHLPTGTTAPLERIFVAPFERAIAEFPGHYLPSEEDGRARPVLLPHAYHLAVAEDGSEHWAIFVGQKTANGVLVEVQWPKERRYED